MEVIKVLVQLGADKEARDVEGRRPLHVAAAHGEVEAVKKLVYPDADASRCARYTHWGRGTRGTA